MTLSKKIFFKCCLFAAFAIAFTSCQKDEDTDPNNNSDTKTTGMVEFEITDAPIDNTNIKGSFVTITAVKVDGEVISGFNGKQTIDLMAYQNGDTKALGLAELETGTYSNISLVLDYSTDVNGNAPGCYVLTNDDVKHSLQSTSSTNGEITINSEPFVVAENTTTQFVLDFDVRKAIKKQDNPEPNDQYDFVTAAELRTSVRATNKTTAAKIKGNISDIFGMSGDKVVVYAYKKGSFNKDTEVQGQGSSNITFNNSVTSCVVEADGSYTLAFLSEGEYEVHYVSYEEEGNDGSLEAKGFLEVSSLLSLDILGLEVNASADITLDVTVLAVNPI